MPPRVLLQVTLLLLLLLMRFTRVTGRGQPHSYHTIGAIFEKPYFNRLSKVFHKTVNLTLSQHQLTQPSALKVNDFCMTSTPNVYSFLYELCQKMSHNNVETFIVVGRNETIHAVNALTAPLGIPVLGYIIESDAQPVKIHHPLYLRLEPNTHHMSQGVIKLLDANRWYEFSIIVEASLEHDGFLTELRDLTRNSRWHVEDILVISIYQENHFINMKLNSLKDDKSKKVVLHGSVNFATLIFTQSETKDLIDLGHMWILTEIAVTKRREQLLRYPRGTLAVFIQDIVHPEDIIKDIVAMTVASFDNLKYYDSELTNYKRVCGGNVSTARFGVSTDIYKTMIKSSLKGDSGHVRFDDDGVLQISKFKIRSLFREDDKIIWKDIGFIRGNEVKLSAIIWPTKGKVMPFGQRETHYRVVANPVKPFVFQQPTIDSTQKCSKHLQPCLKVNSKDKGRTISLIKDYENDENNVTNSYEIRCCGGLTIDLLKKLATDLEFRFTLYLVFDETYGAEVNKSWNGMVRDLIDGTAHVAVGAFSITRSRSRVIDFTYPYFFSRFSVLVADRAREPQMHAFLEPFSIWVWLAILLSASISAVAMALFEWNSPFGLNPWGRKRKMNYTLASGLTMVYSVLFGHTVKTKSPKAWPSKVMQNCWSFACIFIIASYTANMASFIAGNKAGRNYEDVYDPRLLDIRVGILEGSAVDSFLRRTNQKLYLVSKKFTVPSSDVGIKRLIDGKLDGYLGDYPILDYARTKLDPRCELKLMGQTFGEDSYGLGLPRGSPLMATLSTKIREYELNNVIRRMELVHFADAQCYVQRRTQKESQLAVSHHAGLFVMLSVGVGVGILVCLLEHAVFRWMVPYLRTTPGTSCWRSIHVMFFSQRLHRIICSAELVNPHDSAREILGIMRKREFTRLFMKSTIRKNKLADMAKTKRLNRNFYDIVEKAKWMQELREKQLIDDSPDSSQCPPHIVEIQLRDLGLNTEQHADDDVEETTANGKARGCENHSQGLDQSADWAETWPTDWLLGDEGGEHHDRFSNGKDSKRIGNGNADHADGIELSLCRTPEIKPRNTRLSVRFADTLPNGHVSCGDLALMSEERLRNTSVPGVLSNRKFSWCGENTRPFYHHNRQTSLPFKNNRMKSFAGRSPRLRPKFSSMDGEQDSLSGRTIDELTKEELLSMWKTSEEELNRKLDKALKDKAKLEQRLAEFNSDSPI